jgi:uncharacterized protein YecE (DUF72 family)
MAHLFTGTSGFAYASWKPRFYPEKLPQKKFLEHYARRLNAVEINYTFRRTPSASTLASWAETTPAGFVFCLKAHQRITHFCELKNAAEPTRAFLEAIEPLRSAHRLGPVLFQLPPQLECDLSLLQDFLQLLPHRFRFAFEFRHESWLVEPVYTLLAHRNISLCIAESETLQVPEVLTADFVYYRFRKPDYSAGELEGIRRRTNELVAEGKDVFAFFKHEDTPEGALSAEQILNQRAAA